MCEREGVTRLDDLTRHRSSHPPTAKGTGNGEVPLTHVLRLAAVGHSSQDPHWGAGATKPRDSPL